MKYLIACSMVIFCSSIFADDWRAIRGNDGVGVVNPGEILARNQAVELKVAWKKKIGSGYSSVVVAGQRVIVLFSHGENDVIRCLNASSGETVWQQPIGPRFVGKNGSFDGPISTPVVDEDLIFVINPLGKVLCFRLDDGSEVWSRDLQEQDDAPLPLYGFTTSPVVFQDQLIIQTGTESKALASFDKKTGESIWVCSSEDKINSQIPQLTRIGNQPVLLAAGGKKLTGVDPEDGQVLFEYEHEGANGSAMMPVVFDENKVLLTLDDRFSKAVSLRPVDEKINVSEEWQQPTIKNTYNVPAIYNGNAFAFSTRILTSVDTKTGQANWKSRKPGDGFLIVVDGHMIISTKKGGVYVAPASADKYEPIAQLELFDDLVWSIPAYSDNSIYLRSLGEVARVDIVPTVDSAVASETELMPSGEKFSNFVSQASVLGGDRRKQLVDEFMKNNPMPVVEGDIVHFVYRGPGGDVAVASDVFGARQERKMKRAGDSDLFYYAVELPSDQRANYVFVVDYEMTLDAHNMQRVTTSSVYAGEMEFAMRLPGAAPLQMNWFAMNQWTEPAFTKVDPDSHPELIEVSLQETEQEKDQSEDVPADAEQSESTPSPQQPAPSYQVLLPPGYKSETDKRYHVVYVMLGSQAQKLGALPALINDIFVNQGKPGYIQVDPCIVVFTDNAGPPLTEKIIASVDSKFRTRANREGRSLMANAFMASAGFSAAFESSDLFSGVSSQSPLMFEDAKQMVQEQIKKLNQPVRVYMDWGNFDLFNPDENWDMRKDGKAVYDIFKTNRNIQLAGGEVHDSTDWSSWRNRVDQVLKHITGS